MAAGQQPPSSQRCGLNWSEVLTAGRLLTGCYQPPMEAAPRTSCRQRSGSRQSPPSRTASSTSCPSPEAGGPHGGQEACQGVGMRCVMWRLLCMSGRSVLSQPCRRVGAIEQAGCSLAAGHRFVHPIQLQGGGSSRSGSRNSQCNRGAAAAGAGAANVGCHH